MNFREFLKENIVVFDGAMGTQLAEHGLISGELPEMWNISHPDVIEDIHRAYFDSGSNVVLTNTFGANLLKYGENELRQIITAAIENAKHARNKSINKSEKFIALDIGPLGRLIRPFGDLDFEDAVSAFAKTVSIGSECGVDLIFIETITDSHEAKAAVIAAKENSCLPIILSCAYGEDGNLLTGASPSAVVTLLEGLGVDAIGANCSFGPDKLSGVVDELIKCSSFPILFKPNAGLPEVIDGRTVYSLSPDDFANALADKVNKGVRAVGGCCGTSPEYIRALSRRLTNTAPKKIRKKNITAVSSFSRSVVFGKRPIVIGERINPTGKPRFKQALTECDVDYILGVGISEEDDGADILDINVGLPGTDEKAMLVRVISELQAITPLPLQIDTSNISAMEAAMRIYNGKPLINSVNGKKESMHSIFPLVKKYGGTVIALTLDENGIPASADARIKIAEKILKTAKEYGIDKKDMIFDPLAMSISAAPDSANVTLEAVRRISSELKCHTSLGISNISFGLPSREIINSIFYAQALEAGLSAAIINPSSEDMKKAYYAHLALHGLDVSCSQYIDFATKAKDSASLKIESNEHDSYTSLEDYIIRGLSEKAKEATKLLLLGNEPMEILKSRIIPALDTVGKRYESGEIYLPGLLMSAEAAKSAFEAIKASTAKKITGKAKNDSIVIATVHGDIHDIGKNIVKLLLENYGFNVIDLGKDVPCEAIAEAVKSSGARLVGLSALMTTTVPAMEHTIKTLKAAFPDCKIVVGGAVLTEEYAQSIGADKYARDAMETVRYAESIYRN